MNVLDKQLYLFSWFAIVVFGLMIVIPVLLRRREVFSGWSFFLLGALVYTGLSGLNSAEEGNHYMQYDATDYRQFYVGTVVFYSAWLVGYCLIRSPRRAAGTILRRWPAATPMVLGTLSVLGFVLSVFVVFPPPIPVLGQLLYQFGLQAPILALACTFMAWNRDRGNLVALGLLGIALVIAPIATLAGGTSRRYLLSALATIPICYYWQHLRKKSMKSIVLVLALTALVIVPVIMGYSAIRRSRVLSGANPVTAAVESLMKLPEAIRKGGSRQGLRGADSVDVGLAAIRATRTRSVSGIEMTPLFSIRAILVNPIPRAIWPKEFGEKPEFLGVALPRQLGRYRYGFVNWGVNPAGQCYYDGGLPVHVLYGLLLGVFIRFIDEILVRQVGNPFLLAVFSASCSQILALPRGDLALFMLQIIAAVATILVLCWLVRLVFGVGHETPQTNHIDDPREAERYIESCDYWTRMAEYQAALAAAAAESERRK